MSYGRFGVCEICNVTFRPLSSLDIGSQHFDAMQPCLYIETAQTSSLEGAATTVYAQGGMGNPRLIAWEGERTLTLNITDALMSTVSFAMLSGAGVTEGKVEGGDTETGVIMHTTYDVAATADNKVSLAEVAKNDTIYVKHNAPMYAVKLNSVGGMDAYIGAIALSANEQAAGVFDAASKEITFTEGDTHYTVKEGDIIRIDCYTAHKNATEITIDAENFAGYYYIEADTLFRDEETGKDFAAEFVIPRGKIQSNFTFSMASSGDPSTFDFVIDAFPAYTAFNKARKVLCVLNVLDPTAGAHDYSDTSIHEHEAATVNVRKEDLTDDQRVALWEAAKAADEAE